MAMATKLVMVESYLEGLLPIKLLDLWSSDKLKPSYLHDQSVYDLQTWQNGDLRLGVSGQKVTWFFDPMVLQDHVRN